MRNTDVPHGVTGVQSATASERAVRVRAGRAVRTTRATHTGTRAAIGIARADGEIGNAFAAIAELAGRTTRIAAHRRGYTADAVQAAVTLGATGLDAVVRRANPVGGAAAQGSLRVNERIMAVTLAADLVGMARRAARAAMLRVGAELLPRPADTVAAGFGRGAGVAALAAIPFIPLVALGWVDAYGATAPLPCRADARAARAAPGASATWCFLIAYLPWEGAVRGAEQLHREKEMARWAGAETLGADGVGLRATVEINVAFLARTAADQRCNLDAGFRLALESLAAAFAARAATPIANANLGRSGAGAVRVEAAAWAIADTLETCESVAAGIRNRARTARVQTRSVRFHAVASFIECSARTGAKALEARIPVAAKVSLGARAGRREARRAATRVVEVAAGAIADLLDAGVTIAARVDLSARRTGSEAGRGVRRGTVAEEIDGATWAITDSLKAGIPVAADIAVRAGSGRWQTLGSRGASEKRATNCGGQPRENGSPRRLTGKEPGQLIETLSVQPSITPTRSDECSACRTNAPVSLAVSRFTCSVGRAGWSRPGSRHCHRRRHGPYRAGPEP